MELHLGLRDKVIATGIAFRHFREAANPFSHPHDQMRYLQSQAIGQLRGSKDDLLNPWMQTCMSLWGFEPPKNNRDNARALQLQEFAYNSLIVVLQRSWGKGTDTPPSVEYSPEEAKAVKFLGYPDEGMFRQNMRTVCADHIRKLMGDGGQVEKTVQRLYAICNFAEHAYDTRSPRKSGEGYYCHAMRVLHFTLDHLVQSGTHISQPTDIVDIVTVALLHDALEDVTGLTALPFASRKKMNEDTDELVPTNKRDYTYVLTVQNPTVEVDELHKVNHKLRVSDRAHQCIKALTSPEVETDGDKFKHVVHESPWSITEIIKNMDRVDNVLTHRFSANSWWAHLYKMYESSTGMARLSTGSEAIHFFDEDIPRAIKRLGGEVVEDSIFDRRPPGEYLAYGITAHALHHIRREMLNEMNHTYHTDVYLDQRIKSDNVGSYTLDDEVYPDIKDNLKRCTEIPEDGRDIVPLGISDFIEYEDEVKRIVSNTQYEGPVRPGYGTVFRREMTPRDHRIRQMRAYLDLAVLLGTSSIGIGLVGGVMANHTDQGTALQAITLLGCGMAAGGRLGKIIGDRMYRNSTKMM